MCIHIENPLFSELRIPYCVRAGETATFQLRYPPEKSRFQTGFTLDVIGRTVLIDFDTHLEGRLSRLQ
jgi:hypothetical protein